ncbi:hypothetical protein, partial [Paracoccus sp. (in: a-proteobacteria)]|uniref:hypothetical protein n=1 Tax=Paracoccus sp. TaxID=267 RepID=UPI003A8AA0A6
RDGGLWGKDYGLFTRDEWRALVRAARGDDAIRARVEAAYPDLPTAGQTEDMVAELYADWAQHLRDDPPGLLRQALARIRSFFRYLASALRGEGFHDAARIMERLAAGEIGGRGPGGSGGGHDGGRDGGRRKEQRPEDEAASLFAADIMAQLAGEDERFAYPRATAGSLTRIFAEIDPTVTFLGETGRVDEAEESGADRRYLLRTGKGTDFYVYETDDSVWIDVSRLGEGEGGSGIYAAVGDYAANARLQFIGDPAGLSDIALRRRTDAMLSSAFKHASTDHLTPHQRQLDGDKALGVPPLRWTRGDTLANMAALIEVSTASLAHHVPEIVRARYDFATRTFRTSKGERITDGMLKTWSAHSRVRAAGGGYRTLKRSILLNTLLRAEGGQRSGLLEQALRQSRQLVEHGGLAEVLYQRDMPLLRDAMQSGRAKAAGLVSRDFWRKSPEMFSDWLTDAMGKDRRFNILGAVPGHPLFAELGRNLPSAQAYLKNKQDMDAMRNDWQARAAAMVDRWTRTGKKDPKANEALMDLMHRTTLAGIDPSRRDDWSHTHAQSAARILKDGRASPDRIAWARQIERETAAHKAAYADLRAAWEALPGEFRELYREVRDEYGAMADKMDAALLANIATANRIALRRAERAHRKEMARIRDEGLDGMERMEAIDKADAGLASARKRAAAGQAARLAQMRQAFESNRLSGPYFPLSRFGTYFVTLRDADGRVVSFSRFAKKAQQEAFIREMEGRPGRVERGVLGEGADLRGMVDPRFVA